MFGQALGRGMIVAAAIAVGLMATILIFGLQDSDSLGTLFLMLGVMSLLFTGAGLVGTVIGLATGNASDSPAVAMGAGALAGVLGLFVILVAVFASFAVIDAASSDSSQEGGFIEPDDTSAFSWREFGQAMAVLVPSGIAGGVAALATSPWRRYDAYDDDHDASYAAGDPSPVADELQESKEYEAPLRPLRCPSCQHAFQAPADQKPVCPECGYGA